MRLIGMRGGSGLMAGAFAITVAAMASGAAPAEPKRVIEITPHTPVKEVNRYFSMAAHGPTKKFYVLADQRVVLVVRTEDGTAEASAVIHVFPHATAPDGIKKWINNQHSDAIHGDAAEPARTVAIPAERFHATATKPLDHEVGDNGDEYDKVRVDFTIDAFEDEHVKVKETMGSLDAFIRTRDLPQGR